MHINHLRSIDFFSWGLNVPKYMCYIVHIKLKHTHNTQDNNTQQRYPLVISTDKLPCVFSFLLIFFDVCRAESYIDTYDNNIGSRSIYTHNVSMCVPRHTFKTSHTHTWKSNVICFRDIWLGSHRLLITQTSK